MQNIVIITIVFVVVLYFILTKKDNKTGKNEIIKPHKFTLCSQDSIEYATSLIETFGRQGAYHSTEIYDAPDDLIRSFHFLRDCYYFCEKTPYYKNEEWNTNLLSLYFVSYMAIDLPSSEIPKDILENHKFGGQWRKLNPQNELEDLGLIYWRSKTHWLYWANLFKDDPEMNRRFIELANETSEK